MMPLLALDTPDPGTFLQWIQVLLYLGGGVLLFQTIKEKMGKRGPVEVAQPISARVTQEIPPVSQEAVSGLARRMDHLERQFTELRETQGEQYREILQSGAGREQRINEHIDSAVGSVHKRLDAILMASRTGK